MPVRQPIRLEFEPRGQTITSYEVRGLLPLLTGLCDAKHVPNREKSRWLKKAVGSANSLPILRLDVPVPLFSRIHIPIILEVLQAGDPADDIVRNVEVWVNELQDGPSLPVKELPRPQDRSQRRRHPHLSAKPTSPVSEPTPAQNPAPEQKSVAMVKGLKVMDSQDTALDKSGLGATAAVKRKKIVLESEEESDAKNCLPLEKSPSMSTSNPGPKKKVSRRKGHGIVTTVQNRAAAL
jgi:hypothetical protein